MKALIVFTDNRPVDRTDDWRHRLLHWALRRFLKPGFRHCFVVLPDPAGLTVLDQRSFGLCVWRLSGHGYLTDLALQEASGAVHLAALDLPPVVLPGDRLSGAPRLGHWNCVSLVQNIFRTRPLRPLARTPYMLWRSLTDQSDEVRNGRRWFSGSGR